jgi:predicted RNase H-like nuclease (RuvC/YqgF family)
VSAGKSKTEGASQAERSMEQIFTSLEERIETLSGRVRELSGENARLKGAVLETAAERERFKKELSVAREHENAHAETTAKLERYETEREAVKARIERLLKNLEGIESSV